ncbi:hypothetical protein DesfrDRAFT_2429 [Solidesulfovibrio fructosivorans JJ]]|uniref:Uncharacterized protein n=1 Tax=Solidesulfovibrio fructosivorans JJ] TaxID=596151 RepID=E1JXT0_SOLFR|nr:hypothetical protein [Solidesulfovibrio fructosivorans]EFL50853.1 hypothetical protein DesfrDRAFT_2429 [Solidesulfovibrio fructosivorans JJ]]
MPDVKPKHRRSIFDTLKKSADGRLSLAEAARMADKISVFPTKRPEPEAAPAQACPDESDHTSVHLSDHLPAQVSDQVSAPLSGPVTRPLSGQELGPLSDHELTHAPTLDPTPKYDPTVEPRGVPTRSPADTLGMKQIIRSLAENKRRFLHFIIDNEPDGDDYILNRHSVARALQLTEISVKRYFAEFAELGFFRKETYRHGVCQGLRLFLVHSRCQAFKQHDPTLDLTPDPTHEPKDVPTMAPVKAPEPTGDPTINKEDRKIENLSISSERIAMTWPNLHRAGFDREQFEQITASLAELGKPVDKVVGSLDHAEWELAQGAMRDKEGQPVLDPCAWVFRSLARTGYYRRPKGYVSPEEQAARDAEEEARAVAVAWRKAEQAQFETWRDALSPEKLAQAMHGYPGGPKDAWLKAAWRKSRT